MNQEYKTKIAELNEAMAAIELQKKRLAEDIGSKPFFEAFQKLTKVVPEITRLSWTQYTPHWNDGEACYFSVHEWFYDAEINGQFFEGEYEGGHFDYLHTDEEIEKLKEQIAIANEEYKKKLEEYIIKGTTLTRWGEPINYAKYKEETLKKALELREIYSSERIVEINSALEEFNSLFKSIPSEIFEQIFGDHTKVIITNSGVKIDEYSHD